MKKNWNWVYKLNGALSALALMVTTLNVNTTCMYVMHQSELPESAKSLRKF